MGPVYRIHVKQPFSRVSAHDYIKCAPEKYPVDNQPALRVTDVGERLEYGGLPAILTRRAKRAGVKAPPLHAFRRAFAINMLRAGVDVFRMQKLMGHAEFACAASLPGTDDGGDCTSTQKGKSVG